MYIYLYVQHTVKCGNRLRDGVRAKNCQRVGVCVSALLRAGHHVTEEHANPSLLAAKHTVSRCHATCLCLAIAVFRFRLPPVAAVSASGCSCLMAISD